MATNVQIGDKHSLHDFGLDLIKIAITSPEPNTHIIEVPGADKPLDLTEFLYGGVTYKMRTLTLTFFHEHVGFNAWQGLYSEILNAWHGKRLRIILDTDKSHYYVGRISVSSEKESPLYAYVTLTCEVEPHKYSLLSTLDKWKWDTFSFRNGIIREYANLTIPANKKLTVIGSPIPVTPSVKVSKAMSVTVNGKTFTLAANKMTPFTGVKIGREITLLSFSDTGTVSIEIREESL